MGKVVRAGATPGVAEGTERGFGRATGPKPGVAPARTTVLGSAATCPCRGREAIAAVGDIRNVDPKGKPKEGPKIKSASLFGLFGAPRAVLLIFRISKDVIVMTKETGLEIAFEGLKPGFS